MRLNLGCGDMKLPGWHNVDLRHADECVNLAFFPWPWPDNSADEILASHILEHLERRIGLEFLRECHRLLKPGGVLRIAVPDMDLFIDCMVSGDWERVGDYHWTRLDTLLGGDETETVIQQRHRYMYCFASLSWSLTVSGLPNHRRRTFAYSEIDNMTHAPISLYVDAVK